MISITECVKEQLKDSKINCVVKEATFQYGEDENSLACFEVMASQNYP